MIRYDVIIGKVEIQGKIYPILLCEILCEDLLYARGIVEFMGHSASSVLFRKSKGLPYHPEYILN